jgi:NAD(P) transhydrogenase
LKSGPCILNVLPETATQGGVGEATALYKDTIRGHVQGINFGVLKLVYTKPEGKIIGVHILGDDACELIHYGTALAQSGKTVRGS